MCRKNHQIPDVRDLFNNCKEKHNCLKRSFKSKLFESILVMDPQEVPDNYDAFMNLT